jgi:uncharacterized protein (UPF0276 family)
MLARDIAALRPEQISEHLSFTRFVPASGLPPIVAGFMLPPRHSSAGVVLAAANIAQYRAGLGNIPLAIETPVSYLPPLPGELPDGEFVTSAAEAADCGILLDLHNVLCNARNGRQNVAAFLDALPLERVWEIHLAGGESEAGFWLDSHSGLAERELIEIAAALIPRLPRLRAMIFEIMPERVPEVGLAGIARQLGVLRDLWETRASACQPRTRPGSGAPAAASPLDPESWASLLGAAVTGRASPPGAKVDAAWWDSCAPALELYRGMIAEVRASAVAMAAPRVTRLLLQEHGGAGTRLLLAEFWRDQPQGYTMADEARAFLRFLGETDPALPGLDHAAAEDMAILSGA